MQCGKHICLWAYVSNVKCMYTSASGHIVDCIEFIWGIYTDIVVSFVHWMYLAYLAFDRHICYWHMYGNNMAIKVGFFLLCDLYVQ